MNMSSKESFDGLSFLTVIDWDSSTKLSGLEPEDSCGSLPEFCFFRLQRFCCLHRIGIRSS